MQLLNKAMKTASLLKQDFRKEITDVMVAHNCARHRVTNEIPDEIMFGRKLRRGLPLMGSASTFTSTEGMRERDWAQKLEAKEREDKRRGAKPSILKPGDEVFRRREDKKKGESDFRPEVYKVISNDNGNVTAINNDGTTVKRNNTFFKKHYQREVELREASGNEELPQSEMIDVAITQNENQDGEMDEPEIAQPNPQQTLIRPKRAVKKPDYLTYYVRCIESD